MRSCSVSLRREAPIDREGRASYRIGAGSTEKHGERSDLFDRGKSSARLGRQEHVADHRLAIDPSRLGGIGDLAFDQRGPDIARANGIAGHPRLRALESHRFGQPEEAMLGSDIGAFEGRGDEGMGRGDIDDPAEASWLMRSRARRWRSTSIRASRASRWSKRWPGSR